MTTGGRATQLRITGLD